MNVIKDVPDCGSFVNLPLNLIVTRGIGEMEADVCVEGNVNTMADRRGREDVLNEQENEDILSYDLLRDVKDKFALNLVLSFFHLFAFMTRH